MQFIPPDNNKKREVNVLLCILLKPAQVQCYSVGTANCYYLLVPSVM